MASLLPLLIGMAMQGNPSRLIPVAPPQVFQPAAVTTCMLDPIDPQIPWNEAIVSWNVKQPGDGRLRVEARGIYPDHQTKWYVLGDWSADGVAGPRQSTEHQGDEDGTVYTDTLSLKRKDARLQLRITGSGGGNLTRLSLLTVCFADTSAAMLPSEPNKAVWGKTIEMPFRNQGAYPNGGVLCSPTSVSMDLWFWSLALNRPDLNDDVPVVQKGVYDPVYKGTGNWPFNAAYVGSKDGMMAYVTRFASMRELEDWIAHGIPVICSVSFQLLNGKELDRKTESGHLLPLIGFTEGGDPIFNDPAHKAPRHVYLRKDFEAAWQYSHQTVYICLPNDRPAPKNPGMHWLYP